MVANTKLVSITPNAEHLIAYCARVSSSNQENPEYAGLLSYLIKHQHWSPFEMSHMVIEITTSRAIAAQLLRHRSFSFQEFSQRYSDDVPDFQYTDGRKQAEKNRQSSTDTLSDWDKSEWSAFQAQVDAYCSKKYRAALAMGISREQARMLLPLGTGTRLYMAGSIRSWIHYIQLRTQPDTQKEHRDIALACRGILAEQCPTIGGLI